MAGEKEIKTVKCGKDFSSSEIIIEKVNTERAAEEIAQTCRRLGLTPLPTQDILEFVEKTIGYHNKTTSKIASFVGVETKL